ncbi:MAG TPA: NADH-quinone oxidoreductase subunit C [Nocardioidaceae bacterium]|nr:NADH-quinone oxidoreductase subunit C [Nocardioidaceae bacterium]
MTTAERAIAFADDLTQQVAGGARFAGLYATSADTGMRLTGLLAAPGEVVPLDAMLPAGASSYPALTGSVPAADWYERAVHDLTGLRPDGHPRLEPLLVASSEAVPRRVGGHGLFSVPYGPVRGGVHESVEYVIETPGEDIPHLRIRVAAKHRGIQERFQSLSVADGVRLAERVEGIASVAHALAYSHAVERLAGVEVSRPAGLVRVLHAELERVANHLDVAIGLAEAAGLVVAVSRFGWHKENVLRLAGRLCGSRFGRGVVVPGGVRSLPLLTAAEARTTLETLTARLASDVAELMGTATFLDRLRETGPLSVERAREWGALGPIGRASGVDTDARLHRPYDGYLGLRLDVRARREAGDAQERLRVRWDEVTEALHLIRSAVDALDGAAAKEPIVVPTAAPDGRGIGWAEAPQGEVLYAVDITDGSITRCYPRSASFHNLGLFPDVFAGDIFTDFAFIEASFGLSIAGVAL